MEAIIKSISEEWDELQKGKLIKARTPGAKDKAPRKRKQGVAEVKAIHEHLSSKGWVTSPGGGGVYHHPDKKGQKVIVAEGGSPTRGEHVFDHYDAFGNRMQTGQGLKEVKRHF